MNAKYLIGLITAGTLFLGACEFPGTATDDEESKSSVTTSSMMETSSSSVATNSMIERTKKEDLKQASDKEIADIRKDMSPEEIKEMDAMLGDLSPECAGAFMALEVEEESDPSKFMNSECFGEFKEASRPDGLSATCDAAFDEAFSVMQTNTSEMMACVEKFENMPEDEEPTSDLLAELLPCMKTMEEIEASAKAAEECDGNIKLLWSEMEEDESLSMDDTNEDQSDYCDMNDDGTVDQTEEEQCFQGEEPDCDFNKDGEVDESEGMKCMEDMMKGMCDMDQDGTVSEEEKMECDKMMEESPEV
jgi:hypothetical protein